jgi:tetratricopeptide (TPR) repeat protein
LGLTLAQAQVSLAFCHNLQGKAKEADTAAQRALDAFQRSGSAVHPQAALALYQRGWAHTTMSAMAKAEGFFKESIALYDRLFPEAGHPMQAFPLNHLGTILLRDRKTEALPPLQRALEIRRRCLAKGEWWLTVSVVRLGTLYLDLERFAEAEPLLIEGYEQVLKARGPRDPGTRAMLERLIRLYRATKKPEQVDKYERILEQTQRK